MKRVHPNAGHCVIAALTLLIGVTGCRSQQGGVVNPFLAPNRVPPPATRAIMPGQAQPYYPGDPLPVMQSGTPQSMGAVAATAAARPMPSADTSLAWDSPSQQPIVASAPPPRAFAAANEPGVRIPNDTGALRFDLPPTVASTGAAASTPTSSGAPTPSPAQPSQLSPAANQGVVQASYAQPVANSGQPVSNEQPTYSITQAPTSPWRSPQIAQPATLAANASSSTSAWAPVLQQMPLPPPPSWVPNPTPAGSYAGAQNVQLRAVASPAAPGEAGPRIRFPGYTATAQNVSPSTDGFRPRSSMK